MSDKPTLAYSIDDLPIGRTKAYTEIAAGRLRAVKLGQRTLILAGDLKDYLAGLPEARLPSAFLVESSLCLID